jgi:putative glutamine amidotransferase
MITIGVADTMISEDKYQQYITWLNTSNIPLEYRRLSYTMNSLKELDHCNALLLTGGNDVDPALYGGATGSPKIQGVDLKRDSFERKLLDSATKRNLPVLGICRGLQLVNVHFGGTLIPDLEDAGFPTHRSTSRLEINHDISIVEDAGLRVIVGRSGCTVNSFHHQAAGKIGNGLRVAARSSDGVIEAMELNGGYAGQFFYILQWHPERMRGEDNPCSKNILISFINSVNESIQ